MNTQALTILKELTFEQSSLSREVQLLKVLAGSLTNFETALRPYSGNPKTGALCQNTLRSQFSSFQRGIKAAILSGGTKSTIDQVRELGTTFKNVVSGHCAAVLQKGELSSLMRQVTRSLSDLNGKGLEKTTVN